MYKSIHTFQIIFNDPYLIVCDSPLQSSMHLQNHNIIIIIPINIIITGDNNNNKYLFLMDEWIWSMRCFPWSFITIPSGIWYEHLSHWRPESYNVYACSSRRARLSSNTKWVLSLLLIIGQMTMSSWLPQTWYSILHCCYQFIA